MPFLAGLISVIFGQIFEFFIKYMTRKLAFYTAMIASITALTAALFVSVKAILLGIKVTLPIAAGTAAAFLPNNLSACLAAYGSVTILKWAYDWNAGFIQKNLFI